MSDGNNVYKKYSDMYTKYLDQPILFGMWVALSFSIVILTTSLGTFLATENFGKGITPLDGIVCVVLMCIIVVFFVCTIQIGKAMRKRAIQAVHYSDEGKIAGE